MAEDKAAPDAPALDVGGFVLSPGAMAMIHKGETVTPVSRTDVLIEAWFVERINSSIVSRNTEIFNYVRAEVDDLKRRLKQEI